MMDFLEAVREALDDLPGGSVGVVVDDKHDRSGIRSAKRCVAPRQGGIAKVAASLRQNGDS